MNDSSDKPIEQGPTPGPQDKVFLTSILTRHFCPPGTNTLRHQFELKFGADLHGTSGKQSRSNRSSPQSQTHEVVVPTIARITRLPITDECAENESQRMQFIDGLLSRIVEGDIEYQLINGDGSANNIRGLFFHPAEPNGSGRYADPHYKLAGKRTGEDLVEFYQGALDKYRAPWPEGAERNPTHIILPVESWTQLKKQSDSHTPVGDLEKLWNLRIMASNFVPEGRGLILDINHLALVLTDEQDLKRGIRQDCALRGYSTMSITRNVNLHIDYPQAIMLLSGLDVAQDKEHAQEAQELLEEQVVESTLAHIEESLSSRKKHFNEIRDILQRYEKDAEVESDSDAANDNDTNKMANELQSYYEKIRDVDNLVEDIGNKNQSAFIIVKSKKDKDTYEYKRFQHWLHKFPREDFFFRGQSKKWQVTSSLYRSLLEIGKGSCLLAVEKRILTAARYINFPHTPKSEIFADLQHFGGKTNYIDFTANLTTALYFACKDNLENDGEVFMIRRGRFPIIYPIGQVPEEENYNSRYTAVTMAINQFNIQRAATQRSLFIRSRNGCIDFDESARLENLSVGDARDFMVLTIKAEEKRNILGFLRREGFLEEMTYFEDIMGIIERDKSYDKPCAKKEDILRKFDRYDNMEREIRRHRAVVQKMSDDDKVTLPMDSPHYYIGRILYSRSCYEQALKEFLKAEICHKPLAMPPHLYLFLASTYISLKEHHRALEQLNNVKEEERGAPYHFISADARFRTKNYQDAWDDIENAVEMNESSMAYLRLKILIAHELNYSDEVESSANKYFEYCAYDPEIIGIRNQHRLKNQT